MGDVDEEVHGEDECCEDGDGSIDEPVVAVGHGFDEVLAEAGETEDLFDDEGAADEGGERGSEVGDDGRDAATEGMLEENHVGGDAFGAGGADVVLSQLVEHGAAGETGDVSCVVETERERSEDPGVTVFPARDVEEVEAEAEDGGEDGADDEGG